MLPLVVVLIEPELVMVPYSLEILVRFDVFPEEFPFHGLVVALDLSIVFRSVRRIYPELYAVRNEMVPELLRIESIVRPDRFDPSRKPLD